MEKKSMELENKKKIDYSKNALDSFTHDSPFPFPTKLHSILFFRYFQMYVTQQGPLMYMALENLNFIYIRIPYFVTSPCLEYIMTGPVQSLLEEWSL